MVDMNSASMDLVNMASGTAVNPQSWPMPMISTHFGSWNTMFMGDAAEEAEKLRDPSHVRNYSEAEWREFFADAGLEVDEVRIFDHPVEFEPWLERTGCTGDDARRVRDLVADRLQGDDLMMERIALRARPA